MSKQTREREGNSRIVRQEVFSRELFFAFYIVFFIVSMVNYALADSRVMHLFTKAVQIVYAPGMIFACGYYIAVKYKKNRNDFRTSMKRAALCCISLYGLLAVFHEVIILRRNPFLSVRNVLSFIKIPLTASVFLTLFVLFILAFFFWDMAARWLEKPPVILAVCAVGFLPAFLPEGIIGYGLVGVLIGGDRFSCIPVSINLFAFFWGAYCAKNNQMNIRKGRNLPITGICLVLAAVFGLLRLKVPCFTFLGLFCAFPAANVCMWVSGVYARAEKRAAGAGRKLWAVLTVPEEERKISRGKARLLYFVVYTVLFAVVATAIFFPYIQEHRTLIWLYDGLGQYVPKVHRFIKYIPEIIKDILHGNLDFKQYDFTTGLGATVAISFDPIYWLNLLFSSSQVESAYSFLIILRYYLAGLSLSVMILYFKKSRFAAYAASMAYAFSGYAIYAGTRHGQFLTPLILLPILVVAMERLIREKKWYLMTVMAAVSLLCSYYFLYMNTIALGIYFILRILCTKEYRNWKTFFGRGFIIAGSYLLGVCIGCISLVTSFGSYMGSARTGGSSLSDFLSMTPLYYRTEWIADFFISFVSDSFTPGLWLKLGFAPMVLFAVVLLFTRKNRIELKLMFVIFTVFCIFPIFGYIFSGFSSVNNRWCYIYAALVSFLLAEALEKMWDLTGKELAIMVILTAFYGMITFLSEKLQLVGMYGVFGLVAATLLLLFVLNSEKICIPRGAAKVLLLGMTVLTIFFNANWFITSGEEGDSHLDTYVEVGKSIKKMSNTALKNLDKVEKKSNAESEQTEETSQEQESTGDIDGFYRSTNLWTYGVTRSSSMIYGYNDLSVFSSTLNGGIVNYNSAMGNCDWNVVSVYDYNFRTYMNTLASVRYLGVKKKNKIPIPYGYKKVQQTKKYAIYENEYTLPLGYTYDTVMSVSDAEPYSAAEKQELTMLTAIVEDEDVEKDSNIGEAEELPLTAEKLAITDMKLKGVKISGDIIEVTEDSSITFYFEGKPNAETYLSLDGDIYAEKDAKEHFIKTDVKAKGTKYEFKFRIDSYSTGQDEYLFNLGYHKKGITSCTLKFKAEGMLKYDEIAIYSQSMDTYAARVNALKENSLENVKAEKNTVTGDITVDADKMLVITLPYQSGWTAYVDGKETEIQRVNYQYMGLNLSAGTHSIRLHYQLPGLKYAFVITGGSVAVFAGIIVFNIVRKRKTKPKKMY